MLGLWEPLHSLEEGMPPLHPSKVEDFVCLLHKCRQEKNLDHALRLHAHIRESGLEAHPSLGNHLISMLVEVGSMCHAQQVFNRLAYQDVCSWNALIIGYVKHGESQHALTLYNKMQQYDSLHPNGYTFVALLKACSILKDLERGREIHAEIAMKGLLETNVFVGSTLVDMYARCGSLAKAQEVFDKLPVRNVVSWNALLTGYVEHGHAEEALSCFKQMQCYGISPNAVTLLCSLKACGSIGATDKGHELHAEIARKGLERDLVVGSALVDMYAKCGSLAKAQEVFDKLQLRNAVSWTALMAGYAEHGCGEEALYCLEKMKHEGFCPGSVTFVCSLKACSNLGSVDKGQEIHAEIVRNGLERDLVVGSTLVDMYAKCGSLATAHAVFDKLPVRDVVSWTALMAGYAEHGSGEKALYCCEQMQCEGLSPSAVTLVCNLKVCGSIGATNKGQEIHANIVRKGLLERDIYIGSTLVDMYAKCGLLAEAQEVFDRLAFRLVVSWNALITGYYDYGQGVEALNCFQQMQHEGISPDVVTLVCSLKACGSIGATDKGQEIHAEITKKGLEKDLVVGSNLINMYARCGSLSNVEEVFQKLPVRNVVLWTALIAGYVDYGLGKEALYCFKQMQREGVSPDAATFVCILKACGNIGAIVKGQEIHAEIARKGLERELLIGNALVDMYAKCGFLVEAREVFGKLPDRTAVSWTALIAGYSEHGHGEEAICCFEQMQYEGISLDAITVVCILKACGSIGALEKGCKIHAEIVRKGLLERDFNVGSALVDMYTKCDSLGEAQEEFDKLLVRNVFSWTALVVGYAELGHGEEALYCFEQMKFDGISPGAVTFVCSLKACGSTRATDKGREIHADIAKKGLEEDLVIGSALVDMYAKCGSLATAQEVFDKLRVQDVVLWNALIAGYAQLGDSENACHIFDRMIGGGIKPDMVTFLIVLNACSHAGLIDRGQMYFKAMSNDYGFIPTLEHYTCMVDLLGRAGRIDEAIAMIKKMPWHPGIVVWHSVLGACRKWGNVELGRHAFEQAVRLDEQDAASYVCMSNIYVDAAMQEEANKIEAMRVENKGCKKPGHSRWQDTGVIMHSFMIPE